MISIFAGAIILSIWGVTLFLGKSLGLSVLIFVIPFIFFLIELLEKRGKVKDRKAKIMLIPITLLSSTYCIFNDNFFGRINIFAIPILTAVMILCLLGRHFKLSIGLIADIIGVELIPITYISETLKRAIKILKENLNIKRSEKSHKKIGKIIKAILITIPITLAIIILLSSADKIFESIFSEIFRTIFNIICKIKFSTIMARIALIIIALYIYQAFFTIFVKNIKTQKRK